MLLGLQAKDPRASVLAGDRRPFGKLCFENLQTLSVMNHVRFRFVLREFPVEHTVELVNETDFGLWRRHGCSVCFGLGSQHKLLLHRFPFERFVVSGIFMIANNRPDSVSFNHVLAGKDDREQDAVYRQSKRRRRKNDDVDQFGVRSCNGRQHGSACRHGSPMQRDIGLRTSTGKTASFDRQHADSTQRASNRRRRPRCSPRKRIVP